MGAGLQRAFAAAKATRGCQSCDGKGRFIDTTYDRSGEEVPCNKCYGTGMSQEAIHRYLKPKRKSR